MTNKSISNIDEITTNNNEINTLSNDLTIHEDTYINPHGTTLKQST
jgi:hypothetical protein